MNRPGGDHRQQTGAVGFDFEGDLWVDGIQDRQDLLSRLRWHPDVVAHTLPFWLEADVFSNFRGDMEDEIEDQYLPNLLRGDRDAQSDFIDDQRKMVGLKENQWEREELPVPDDDMVNEWVRNAWKVQQQARQTHRPSFLGPKKEPREGDFLIRVVPPGEEGDS
jgi:hypothetical protein